MNWKQSIFKPKWQNSNADVRLEAVSTEQHPDLIASLLEIAGKDEDKRVRCAAIKRLHQLENILKLHGSETDQEVKKLLEDRIRQLASSSNESRPPLEFRMQVVETTSDRDLIEHLASHAPEAELRLAALARVERQGVLGDCCINDSDAKNRNFAADRITQHTTLKRVIDALRKSDKLLYAKLQERLHQELLEQADPGAVQTEAVRICSVLEKQLLDIEARDLAEIDRLHSAWQKISDHASSPMLQRYQRVCERLAAPPVAPPEPAPTPAEKPEDAVTAGVTETPTVPPASTDATGADTQASQPDESLARLADAIRIYETENAHPSAASISKLKQQLEKAWKHCKPAHAEDEGCYKAACDVLEKLEAGLEKQRQQFEKELGQARELLKQLETELEQGELHKALETRAKLQQAAKGHGKNKEWQKLNNQLNAMQARLRELRDWQHWSNNKIRKRLIAEMEVLPSADLHPDALLDRIKSLQQEWKNLEQSEQIPGDKQFSAAPWMWRKFSAAGHAAFDTAKPFLDKRSEIQSRHAQSLATFCAELAQLAQADPVDWIALSKGLVRGRKKLQDLNEVPASQRQKLARKLKATLDKSNAALQAHYQVVELEKMKLIRSASQLIHMPERSEAIAQAKSLQSNWKAAGSLWRSKEQELWNQFRAHLDPLFDELKNQQANIRAADSDRLAAQKALCGELKGILNSKDDLTSLHGKVHGLQDSWKDIEHPDRKLQTTFQNLVEQYEQRVKQAQQQHVKTNRERLWLKSALLHELTVSGRTAKGTLSKKTEAKVTSTWPADSSEDALESRMDEICRETLAGEANLPGEDEIEEQRSQARALCIALEFLAGLPSPDEDRDQRMKYQVDRLAESMSGARTKQPASEEALEAEKTWLGLYALPEADFETFGKRIKRALSAILETV
jgi:exonuclease SbcC